MPVLQDIIKQKLVLTEKAIASDPALVKQVQSRLTALRLLDPPADGKWGKQSAAALLDFQQLMKLPTGGLTAQVAEALVETKEVIPLKLGNDLASRVVKYCITKNYFVPVGVRRYFICYLEGCNADGSLNSDLLDHWNDRRIVIEIPDGKPKIVANYLGSCEAGEHYVRHPMNPRGCARIQFAQFKSWQVGIHGNSEPHEALVQVAPVQITRDRNKDGMRTGDAVERGLYGINQHSGFDMERVGRASAGCLIGKSRAEHRAFMALIKKDKRYQISSAYVFMSTVICGSDLVQK